MTLDARKVYLMDSVDCTKIGYATDPDTRLSSTQSGNPLPLRLAGVIETDHAPRLEEKLHQLLADYRCEKGGGTEWFDLPADIDEVLAETAYVSVYALKSSGRKATNLSRAPTPLPRFGVDYSETHGRPSGNSFTRPESRRTSYTPSA